MITKPITQIPKDLNEALEMSITKYEKFLVMFKQHDLHICFDIIEDIGYDHCGLCAFFNGPWMDCEECPVNNNEDDERCVCSDYWTVIRSQLMAFYNDKFFSWSILIDQTEKLIQQMKEAIE